MLNLKKRDVNIQSPSNKSIPSIQMQIVHTNIDIDISLMIMKKMNFYNK